MRLLPGAALHAFRMQQVSYVRGPYIGIAVTLFVLGCVVALQKLPRGQESETRDSISGEQRSVWSYRHLVLGIVAMFLYCGAEITIGSFLVSYSACPPSAP